MKPSNQNTDYQSYLYFKKSVCSFFLASLILLSYPLLAQKIVKRSLYQTIIDLQDGQKRKGILFKVNETSIELIKSLKNVGETIDSETFDVIEIKSISILKHGSSALGFAIGATIGGVLGTLIILQSYPGTYSVAPAIIAGAITLGGGVLGANHFRKKKFTKTYKIGGDQELFDQAKKNLVNCQLKFE